MRNRTPLVAITLAVSAALAAAPAPAADEGPAKPKPLPTFRVQEIEKSLKVGYGVVVANVNADDKPDIVVADAGRVLWYENPSWERHTIIENDKAGIKTDNVCLDVYDIDGDGKLDVAARRRLAAGQHAGRRLASLAEAADREHRSAVAGLPHRRADPHAPPRPTSATSTATAARRADRRPAEGEGQHRQGELGGQGRADPLQDPRHARLARREVDAGGDDRSAPRHAQLLPRADPGWRGVITASYEGLNAVQPDESSPGKWVVRPSRFRQSGQPQGQPRQQRGEAREALRRRVADPWRRSSRSTATRWPSTPRPPAARGHAGRRGLAAHGPRRIAEGRPRHRVRRPRRRRRRRGDRRLARRPRPASTSTRPPVSSRPPATPPARPRRGPNSPRRSRGRSTNSTTPSPADLFCFDLNGDKRVDIVASGRATKNVRIYWNEPPAK